MRVLLISCFVLCTLAVDARVIPKLKKYYLASKRADRNWLRIEPEITIKFMRPDGSRFYVLNRHRVTSCTGISIRVSKNIPKRCLNCKEVDTGRKE